MGYKSINDIVSVISFILVLYLIPEFEFAELIVKMINELKIFKTDVVNSFLKVFLVFVVVIIYIVICIGIVTTINHFYCKMVYSYFLKKFKLIVFEYEELLKSEVNQFKSLELTAVNKLRNNMYSKVFDMLWSRPNENIFSAIKSNFFMTLDLKTINSIIPYYKQKHEGAFMAVNTLYFQSARNMAVKYASTNKKKSHIAKSIALKSIDELSSKNIYDIEYDRLILEMDNSIHLKAKEPHVKIPMKTLEWVHGHFKDINSLFTFNGKYHSDGYKNEYI